MSSRDLDYPECKIVHQYIMVEPLNKKFCKVNLKKDSTGWSDFLDDALDYSKEHKCWIIKNEEIKEFQKLLDNVSKDEKEHRGYQSEQSSSESESESDDELAKLTLQRRLKSESSQYEIEEETVEDSLDEDVISTSRRLRYLYKVISSLRKRIEALEAK